MVGNNRNKWTAAQLTEMERLHNAGIGWSTIARLVGHSLASCQAMMTRIRADRRIVDATIARREEKLAARAAARSAGKAAPPQMKPPHPKDVPLRATPRPVPPPAPPAPPPSPRTRATSTLLLDAELRARIEILGATGGLLGDPLPGRSALDRKRTGALR